MGVAEVQMKAQRIISEWAGKVELRGDDTMRISIGSTAAFIDVESFGKEDESTIVGAAGRTGLARPRRCS